MNITMPKSLKPTLLGAVAGAVGATLIGFSWGGWTYESTAQLMAEQQAEQAVQEAMIPVCIANVGRDPQSESVLKKLSAASDYDRQGIVMEAGWATAPGKKVPDRTVARKCATEISENL